MHDENPPSGTPPPEEPEVRTGPAGAAPHDETSDTPGHVSAGPEAPAPGARGKRPRPPRAPRAKKPAADGPPPEPVSAPETSRPRSPARRPLDLAGEATPVFAGLDASTSPERLLLELAEREVAAVGEPIPQLRRGRSGRPPKGAPQDVIVPEATLESPPAMDGEPGTGELGLPAITPEILAEVRGSTPAGTAPAGRGGRRAQAGPPRVESAPPGSTATDRALGAGPLPALVLVQEALLESIPPDWVEEQAAWEDDALLDGLAQPADGGRRRRRRGRGRDRQEMEVVPAAALTPAAPSRRIDDDELAPTDRREREARVDREPRQEREREVRTEREYKELLVNVDERETRIAVLESGRLVELHVEREERVVGGVYKARVANVLPGMDAAFVDIGLDRNAFLYVGDILFEDTRGGRGDDSARRTSRDVRIKDLAKPGQEMLVQVVKGPRGTKGARVSTKISIPGRYLVLMPEGDHLGVSRKVEDPRERDRLKRIADQLQPKGFGLIVRTEAEDRTEQELRQDLEYLQRSWKNIVEKERRVRAPAVIHKDLGIILKTIRDLFGSDVDKLVIDDTEEYEKILETLNELAPELAERVELHEDPEPLFVRYHVEEEIERLLRRKVWLRNGAYLLLDTTEALTTIDVNTGKFVGTSSLSETILKTNLDAVDEIARQLRLRDIGGMIVLDFIDMSSSRDRQLVMKKLEDAFKRDRTRTKIAHISPLGLVEMTRKRTQDNVTDVMTHTCPYCQGRGRVWSPETMAIQIEREIKRRCATEEIDAILVYTNPEVAAWMIGAEGESVEQLERLLRRPVYIRARHDYHIEKYEILPGDMLELEEQMLPYHGGQVVECNVTKMDIITPPRSAAWADGYFVDLANGIRFQDRATRVRLTDVRRSFALGEPVAPTTAVDKSEPI